MPQWERCCIYCEKKLLLVWEKLEICQEKQDKQRKISTRNKAWEWHSQTKCNWWLRLPWERNTGRMNAKYLSPSNTAALDKQHSNASKRRARATEKRKQMNTHRPRQYYYSIWMLRFVNGTLRRLSAPDISSGSRENERSDWTSKL